MTALAICNRALSLIGESPNVTSISPPDGSAHAQLCATHYSAAVEFVTESRHWTHTDKRAVLGKVTLASPTADASTDEITTVVAHGLVDDNPVSLALVGGSALPAPLEEDTVYYVIAASTVAFALSETIGGDAIDLTTAGTGLWAVYKESDRDGAAYMYELPSDCMTERNIVPEGAPDDWPGVGAGWSSRPTVDGRSTFYPEVVSGFGRAEPIQFKRGQNVAGELVIYTNQCDAHLVYSAYVTDTTQWPPMFRDAVTAQLTGLLAGAIKRDAALRREWMQIAQWHIGEAARVDSQRVVQGQERPYPWDR